MLLPVALVARLDETIVVGEGRVPVLDVQLVGDAGELRRQIGIVGGALERDLAPKDEGFGLFAQAALDLGQVIAEANAVADLHLQGRFFELSQDYFAVCQPPTRLGGER